MSERWRLYPGGLLGSGNIWDLTPPQLPQPLPSLSSLPSLPSFPFPP